jgi:hypothetical protein
MRCISTNWTGPLTAPSLSVSQPRGAPDQDRCTRTIMPHQSAEQAYLEEGVRLLDAMVAKSASENGSNLSGIQVG